MEISEESVIVNCTRLKSVVWNDFDRVKNGDMYVAICRHCKRKLSGASTSGTSHLRNHLIRCRRRSNHDVVHLLATKGKKKEGTLALENSSFDQGPRKDEPMNLVYSQSEQVQKKDGIISIGNGDLFDDRRSRFDLARMIILHGYPLAMVGHIGFKIFVRNLQPLFELITVNEVEADCKEIYMKEKHKVATGLNGLPGKINVHVDMWAGKEEAGYLSLTAHYIDDAWQVKKIILNFIKVEPSHTEDMIAEYIMVSLMDWDVDRKLFSMTFDNCSTYDNIVCRIRESLSQNKFLLCDGQLFDVRCAANIIKLMVQDVLETQSEVTQKIRESICYVRRSQAMLEKFNEMVQVAGISSRRCLCLDNALQWNSTYIMLEIAVEYKDVFLLLQKDDPAYTMCPSELDWQRAITISGFLKLLVDVSAVFAGSKHTANIYFAEICDIHLQLIEWCQNSDDYISSLSLKMKQKFDEYWKKCSLSLTIASILDPRFKMKLVEYYYSQIYGDTALDCIDIVSNCMKALYNGHAMYSPLASDGPGFASQVGGSGGFGSVNGSRDRLTGFDRFLHETSQSQNIKSDLVKYLEEPLFPRNLGFNILNWWKVHTPRYPILSMMAQNILGIPMSKVPPELTYDIGDRTLNHNWSSLSPDTLQALTCVQDWMHNELEG